MCILWPLLLAPAHYLSYRELAWKARGFAGLYTLPLFITAFAMPLFAATW